MGAREKQILYTIYFGAFCLDVRTLTFCQLMDSIKPLKVKLLAGEQKATEYIRPRVSFAELSGKPKKDKKHAVPIRACQAHIDRQVDLEVAATCAATGSRRIGWLHIPRAPMWVNIE